MNRKVLQILVGAMVLLGGALLGAYGIPTARLEGLVNYPNPFDSRQSATTIRYSLPNDSNVTVRIFDLLGRDVQDWNFSAGDNGARSGANQIVWDGTNESGDHVAAGGYICQVLVEENGGFVQGIRKIGVIH